MASFTCGPTYGIAFNKKMIAERLSNVPLTSWRLLLDPVFAAKLAPCGINFIDDPVAVVQIVLKYLGRDPGAPSPQDFADVEKVLVKIRPYIRTIDTAGEIQAMANGDICISLGYSGDFVQAIKRAKEAKNGIELDYLIPEEGSLVGFDLLAIPKDAPHVANAYLLINYLMNPQVAAEHFQCHRVRERQPGSDASARCFDRLEHTHLSDARRATPVVRGNGNL